MYTPIVNTDSLDEYIDEYLANISDDEYLKLWNKYFEDEYIWTMEQALEIFDKEEIEKCTSKDYKYHFDVKDDYVTIDKNGNMISFDYYKLVDYADDKRLADVLAKEWSKKQ